MSDFYTQHVDENRLLGAEPHTEDNTQQSLRPRTFAEYIGQERLRQQLTIAIDAARGREEALDHVLLYGPPGLGKTTLAAVIAAEMGVPFKSTSGPVIERAGDLAAILTSLQEKSVLFIDEIHRLHRAIEEVLYSAMEDFAIDILIGQGPAARSVRLNLKPFTLIGATTRTGLLTAPLRDRFGIIERIEFYTSDELAQICERSADILGVAIDADGAKEIARRARGTPRIANRLLRRTRDFAEQRANGKISRDVADTALLALDVDSQGLDKMDYALMQAIIERFDGGPVGIDTLAASLSEDRATIEDVYEPYLLQLGFLKRTPRGREATPAAWEYFAGTASRIPRQRTIFEPNPNKP